MLCVLKTRNRSHESVLDDSNIDRGLSDYKIHSFNGDPEIILLCRDRFSKLGLTEDFFNKEWEHLDVHRLAHPNNAVKPIKPEALEKMLELSKQLAKNTSFLRSDFYLVDGKIYFGELTFYPASGFEKFIPGSFDEKLGKLITLQSKSGGGINS